MSPILLLLLLLSLPSLSLSLSDADALLLLKSSFQNSDPSLSSWIAGSPNSSSSSSSPCNLPHWAGVRCFNGIVTGLRLGHRNLSGTINVQALTHLPSLRTLSFVNNSLSGPIPDFSRLDALKSLYLSHNRFAGPIPAHLFEPMDHLKKLWINDNGFSGSIPLSLSKAKSLLELHVENNGFSGELPDLRLPLLRSFNASNNGLSGRVPAFFGRFGREALEGNERLCGPPVVGRACPVVVPAAAPAEMRIAPATAVVAGGFKGGRFFGFVVGVVVVLVLLVVGFAVVKRRQKVSDLDSAGGADVEKTAVSPSGHKRYGSGRGSGAVGGGTAGGLVKNYNLNSIK